MNNEVIIKKVINDFYDIISGKSQEERDWDSFKELFFSNAHIMSVKVNEDNKCITSPVNIESYIVRLESFLKTKDFYEYGLNYKINVFGNIAHVYSEYEAKSSLQNNKLIKRGVNLVQLIKQGDEWKILNMLWEDFFLNPGNA